MRAVKNKKGEDKDKAKRERLQKKAASLMAKMDSGSAPSSSAPNYDTTAKLNTRAKKAGKTDTVAINRTVNKCGVTASKSRGSTQAASNCVAKKKRLSNVGSSPEFKKQKRQGKKNKRRQGKLDTINEKLKSVRRPSTRVAGPRFL